MGSLVVVEVGEGEEYAGRVLGADHPGTLENRKNHAGINVDLGCIEIRDTGRDRRGSTNGTYVDGERI